LGGKTVVSTTTKRGGKILKPNIFEDRNLCHCFWGERGKNPSDEKGFFWDLGPLSPLSETTVIPPKNFALGSLFQKTSCGGGVTGVFERMVARKKKSRGIIEGKLR